MHDCGHGEPVVLVGVEADAVRGRQDGLHRPRVDHGEEGEGHHHEDGQVGLLKNGQWMDLWIYEKRERSKHELVSTLE